MDTIVVVLAGPEGPAVVARDWRRDVHAVPIALRAGFEDESRERAAIRHAGSTKYFDASDRPVR